MCTFLVIALLKRKQFLASVWPTNELCFNNKCIICPLIDIQVKEIDKRASGQAFEVILGAPAPDAKGEFPLSPPKKKDLSLEEIQRKLEAAEERRKVGHAPVKDARLKCCLWVCS